MPKIFEVNDPRGYTVVCSEEIWNSHILANRPFMKGWEDDVKSAIENPTFGIYQDANHQERHIYYRLHAGRQRYIKVVVKFDADNFGDVITAFPTDSMKAGEKLIWTKSSH
jgi:hypothetical protein